MTTLDYTALSYEEQRELLRLNGSFVRERQHKGIGRRTLYALYDFYVELCFDEEDHERYLRVTEDFFQSERILRGIEIALN